MDIIQIGGLTLAEARVRVVEHHTAAHERTKAARLKAAEARRTLAWAEDILEEAQADLADAEDDEQLSCIGAGGLALEDAYDRIARELARLRCQVATAESRVDRLEAELGEAEDAEAAAEAALAALKGDKGAR